jgi:hypothetical protein
MSHPVLFELERNKKRLDYYLGLKSQIAPSRKKLPVDKWIEIYAERVKKLERQAARVQAQAAKLH